MRKYQSMGYNQPSAETFEIQELWVNSQLIQVPDSEDSQINLSSNWEPFKQTQIKGTFRIDVAQIQTQSMLDNSDTLFASLSSYCLGTRLQHSSSPVKIENETVLISLNIPPYEWNDATVLKLTIAVKPNLKVNRKIGSPMVPYSKLLQKVVRFQLGGQETQGNVIFRDFSNDHDASKAYWRVLIDPSISIEDWATVEHSRILKVEVNKLEEQNLNSAEFQCLLLVDIVMTALSDVINDEEKLELLRNDDIFGGSWLRFLRNAYGNIFDKDSLAIKDKWIQNQASIRARVQHVMRDNLGGAK
jgi:hypothetical protein